MKVAVCLYGDVRESIGLADQFRQFGYEVDVFVHKRFADPYPAELAPRCAWLEEPRPITVPEGVSPAQAWVLWSMARLGKMVIQTEQREGRYELIAFTSPVVVLARLPIPIASTKVHVEVGNAHKLAMGTSVDMQLYLNKLSQLQSYYDWMATYGRSEVSFDERVFAEWCLNGMSDKRRDSWVEDLR